MRRTATAGLWVLLLAVPGSVGAPVDVGFSNEGVFEFQGTHRLEWSAAAADLGPQAEATLEAGPVYAYLLNVPVSDVWDGAFNASIHRTYWLTEVLDEWASRGPVRFEVGDGLLRAVPDAGAVRVRSNGTDVALGPAGAVHAEPFDSPYAGGPSFGGRSAAPPTQPPYTRGVLANTTGEVLLEDGWVLLGGGTVRFGDRVLHLPLHRFNEERSTYDPVTGTGHRVYDNHFVAVHVLEGRLAGFGQWALSAYAANGTLDGHASWFGVQGDIRVEDDRATDPAVLEVVGVLEVDGALSESPSRWRVAGEDAAVRADLAPLGTGLGTVVGGLGVLAALLALLALLGRDLVTFLLGRWTPSPVASDPLTSPSRRSILAALHEHQPARLGDLERATGLSRGALRYHLRILEATHVLQRDESGGPRHTTFMLNGGSLSFRVGSGHDASAALSVANTHPVRRAVHRILAGGERDQDGLLEALRGDGTTLSRSTLSHHLSRMVRAGLVGAAWRDGRKRYRSLVDPDEAQGLQYRTFLGREGLLPVVRLLLEGVSERGALVQRLRDGGARDPEKLLRRLEALQLADDRQGNLHLVPFLHTALGSDA